MIIFNAYAPKYLAVLTSIFSIPASSIIDKQIINICIGWLKRNAHFIKNAAVAVDIL